MDKRAAKQWACAWVASLIHAELADGAETKIADESGTDSEEDERRIRAALQGLAEELQQRGKGVTKDE